jgi:predicted dehydrogenase
MDVNIGIVGLGMMGKMHFNTYAGIKGVKVAAIADVDALKLKGDWSKIGGNIASGNKGPDLRGVRLYNDPSELLKDPGVDVVDITLPTFLHAEWTIRALQSGRHVICEKPMALNAREGRAMIKAARDAEKQLFIAQCIRFWPAYSTARELARGGKYGRVVSAVFTRVSARSDWSWRDFLNDPRRSGGCALDLHIHDADFVLHLLGKPKSVLSRAVLSGKYGVDHITTFYEYRAGSLVQAEGAWEYNKGFPFSMSFRIAMEKATLVFDSRGLSLYPEKGKPQAIKTAEGDGYLHELRHFTDCVRHNRPSPIVPPESALTSLELVAAEIESARSGKAVRFKPAERR